MVIKVAQLISYSKLVVPSIFTQNVNASKESQIWAFSLSHTLSTIHYFGLTQKQDNCWKLSEVFEEVWLIVTIPL